MKIISDEINLRTAGNGEMKDLTEKIQQSLEKSALKNGLVTIFVIGSTASVTTIEYEPGLANDLINALEKITPKNGVYEHTERWHDDNGHAHVRASLIGPSLTVPFEAGVLELGTWQQIVLVDFDTRSRQRTLKLKFIGE